MVVFLGNHDRLIKVVFLNFGVVFDKYLVKLDYTLESRTIIARKKNNIISNRTI